MSRKGRGILVQAFPDVCVERWKGLVQDRCDGWNEHFSTICQPDQPTVQLKAVRKLGNALEHGSGESREAWLQVLVEMHGSCTSRHPLQRAIASMLLGLPGDQHETVVDLVARNLRTLLQQQLNMTSRQEEREGLILEQQLSTEEEGEGLVQAKSFLISTHTAMQYMESLLENFSLGEKGLRRQLPLVLKYCSVIVVSFKNFKTNSSSSHAITVLVDTIKITMNILQKNTSTFNDTSLEDCSWSSLAPSVPLSARSEWVQARLSDLLSVCHYFLLNVQGLSHDVVVSAAMLMVVTSNILSSSSGSEDLHGYTECIEKWLSLDHLEAFPKLAVCHALLAKTPVTVLLAVSLEGMKLVLALFPMLCQLFSGFTESSDRYIASRTLALWSTVVRDCVLRGEGAAFLSESLAPSSSIVQTLLQYVWSLWEDPIDGIRHQCKDIFENIIKISKHHGPESGSLGQLANQLLSLESPSRGKFVLLSSLTQHLSPTLVVASHPSLPGDLLAVMGHQALACHAGDLWSRLVQRHWEEVAGNAEKETVWKEVWLMSLLKAMCVSSSLARRHITQHCLPSLFHSNDASMEYVNQHLSIIEVSPDKRVAVQLACLRCAKAECKNFSQTSESISAIFQSSMHHSEEQIRLSALSLVCESVKTTDAPPLSHLRLLLEFIEVNGNSQSPGFREPTLTAFKKVLNRVKDSSYALMKLHLKGSGPDPSPDIDMYKEFLSSLLNQQFEVLHPLSSFQRRNFALSVLMVMASCFQAPPTPATSVQGGVVDGGGGIVPIFVFSQQVSRRQALLLWEGLQDQFDTNRALCLDLLMQLPAATLLDEGEFVKKATAQFLEFVSKPKSSSCASASFMLKFLVTVACSEFNQQLTERIAPVESPVSGCDQYTPRYVTLTLLCALLDQHISVSKLDLLSASVSSPMYGVLQSVRALCELGQLVSGLGTCRERFEDILSRLVEVCRVLSELVSPVVCSSSPEGFLPESSKEADTAGGAAGLSESSEGVAKLLKRTEEVDGRGGKGNAQSLLLCSWHTMKEVSLLLGFIVHHFSAGGDVEGDSTAFLTHKQMEVIAEIFTHQLTEARHRGAFEMAYTGFSQLCHALWLSSDKKLSQQPSVWVEDLLDSLQSSSVAKLLTVTRRSAGLPFFMQAILTSEPSVSGRACLKQVMEVLLKVAHDSVTHQTPPTLSSVTPEESAAAVVTVQPAALHALNILRALYRDSRLGEQVAAFIPRGVEVAIAGFAANHWPVRNSSNLLFTSLVLRMFGAKRVHDEHSMENKLTAREFFTRFPSLYPYLLQQLRDSAQQLQQNRYSEPSLFPVLLLLSRLYPSPLDDAHSTTSIKPFIPLLIKCTSCCVWKTRELVSRTLSLMLTEQDSVEVLSMLYQQMSLTDQSSLHGLLSVVNRTLRDREKLLQCVTEDDITRERRPLFYQIVRLHLQKWWLGTDNSCVITQSLYLEVLNALLELVVRNCGGVVSLLRSETCRQLHFLYAHSLETCGSCKDDPSVLQHVQLLLNSIQYPSLLHPPLSPAHDMSHDQSHGKSRDLSHDCEVVLSVLGWAKDPAVVVLILENRNLLEEHVESGRREDREGGGERGVFSGAHCVSEQGRVLDFLIQRAKESNSHILPVVYEHISMETVIQRVQDLDELVAEAYHLFQNTHNRIEVKVSLIHFLTSSIPYLQFHTQQRGRGWYAAALLQAFQLLVLPTQPQQVRQAVATGVTRLWGVAQEKEEGVLTGEGGGSPQALSCQLIVQLLQDTDSDVREEMALAVSALLSTGTQELMTDSSRLSCTSALRFFISSLPHLLVADRDNCFAVLLGLLPAALPADPTAPQNPLFDEDPLNDYAEDLVVMEHVVKALEKVTAEGATLKQYIALSKVIPEEPLVKSEVSFWKSKNAFLRKKKAELLFPLLKNLVKMVEQDSAHLECGDGSKLELDTSKLEEQTRNIHL